MAPTPAPVAQAPVQSAGGQFTSAGAEPTATAALISPFPVIRIAGKVTRGGARVRLLSVRAPVGALVIARCRGRRCPSKLRRRSIAVRVREADGTRVRSLQRYFSTGARIEVLVSQTGRYGKYSAFRIRRGRAPKRTDMCVAPERRRTAAPCPTS